MILPKLRDGYIVPESSVARDLALENPDAFFLSQSGECFHNVTVTGGNELFLRQVAANTVEKVPVTGITAGSTVTFKAVTVDGSRTYQSRSSPLSSLFLWSVP